MRVVFFNSEFTEGMSEFRSAATAGHMATLAVMGIIIVMIAVMAEHMILTLIVGMSVAMHDRIFGLFIASLNG